MKQQNTKKVIIDEMAFYIRPFGAFSAAGMTATLGKTIGPVLGGVAPVISDYMSGEDGKTKSVEELDFGIVATGIGDSLAAVDPDGLVAMLKMLLTDHHNITYCNNEGGESSVLTEDDCNEIFCQDLGGMMTLALEVVKVNFSGFFGKLAARYGIRMDEMKAAIMKNTEVSTSLSSAI